MATCKDCVHYIACKSLLESQGYIVDGAGEDADKRCKEFADKYRLIELPCKMGDTVWAIRDFKGIVHPQEGIVSEMYFTKEMKLHIVVKYVARGEFGKTVFLTREEAEAELQKRMHKPTTVPDNSERCVCCGDVIPEGRQVCPKCEKGN